MPRPIEALLLMPSRSSWMGATIVSSHVLVTAFQLPP
jgi:hypothetical protein